MENSFGPNLQKIFDLSNILWILQYYSHLDQWKLLLTQLNSKTNEAWRQNQEAFIKFGERHRRDVFLCYSIINNFAKFNENKSLFKNIFINHSKVYNYLFEVIFLLEENEELVVYQSEEYENSFILYISHKEKSSSFLPALEWPNHKPKWIGFKK